METIEKISEEITRIPESGGPSGRGVIGDIEKLKKVAEILETVGQAVLPAIIDSQVNAQKAIQTPSEPPKGIPKGFHLLHNVAIAQQNNDDGLAKE